MNSEHEKILFTKFYNPSTQFTSIKNLYDEVKKNGITLNEVITFIRNQETTQVFKKPKRIKIIFQFMQNINMKFFK